MFEECIALSSRKINGKHIKEAERLNGMGCSEYLTTLGMPIAARIMDIGYCQLEIKIISSKSEKSVAFINDDL
eukprot:5446781-Ditylum_brightwellii.AAC.1